MRIALFQPDIAGNLGTILRMAACFKVPVDIIEPCGFAFSDRALKRAGMDYALQADYVRHPDWPHFQQAKSSSRLILLSTKASVLLHDMVFYADDILLFGSEGAGVPEEVHAQADARVRIPMAAGCRSLNLALSAAIVTAEALRQTGGMPE